MTSTTEHELLSSRYTYAAAEPFTEKKATTDEYQFSFEVRNREATIIVNASRPPRWLPNVISRIIHLLELPVNWNGYGERRIDLQCVRDALSIISWVMQSNTPEPLIFPTSEGGLQLEWHQNGVDIEIEVASVGRADLHFTNADGSNWSGLLYLNFDRLKEVLSRLRV